jgi:hypothetical protein
MREPELLALASLLAQQANADARWGWLAAVAAVALLALAGALFGRTPVDWRLDRYNERVPLSDGCDYDDSDVTGMYEGPGSSWASCAAWWSERPALAGCGSALCAVLGLLLSMFAAGELRLVHFALWWTLLPIAGGYVIGRLTDTGPVGPLE